MKTKVSHVVLALLLGIAAGQALHAVPSCGNKDFVGVYGMLATGTIIVAPGFPFGYIGPFARVGRVVADGHGNLSIANTASYNGVIIPESYGGTYTVGSDCTVDAQPVVPLPIGGSIVPVPFEFKGAIADNGDDITMVLCGLGAPCFAAPTGNVIRIHLSRQDNNQATCTTRDLSGSFQLDMSGSVVSGPALLPTPPYPQPPPQSFARDGRLVFDGRGGFSGTAIANTSGFSIQPETMNGQYSIDPNCNVSISFTTVSTSTTHTWTGTLTDRSNGADLIVAESGVVIAGMLKKQKPGDSYE